jgi:hypothetical protein
MPNHVVNEIIWTGITAQQRAAILSVALNAAGEIDFGIIVPMPLNIWQGSVGLQHEKTFKRTGLDWASENWGTKWNAYSQLPIEQEHGRLRLVFETAWSPPYPWLAALLNRFGLAFDHNWLSEGREIGRVGRFEPNGKFGGPEWTERDAEGEMQQHLYALQWGPDADMNSDTDA